MVEDVGVLAGRHSSTSTFQPVNQELDRCRYWAGSASVGGKREAF